MAIRRRKRLLHQAARVGLLSDDGDRTDAELLDDYVGRRDEAALSVLVRRHGAMVWGVCRRVLSDHHDAEDAFQATFLVLVRRAASIASRDLLANWLHGVARQTARKARATAARRSARERTGDLPEPVAPPPDPGHDLYPLLDEELGRLPSRYRAVFVLCDLEGKTRKEAARELGVPEGSVAGWLARARTELAQRLGRRGVAAPCGPLLAPAAPAALVSATIRTIATETIPANVAALTQEVLTAMLLTRFKTVAFVVLGLGLLGMIASALGVPVGEEAPAAAAQTPEITAKIEHDLEMKRLQGAWLPRYLVTDDGVEPYPVQGRALVFTDKAFLRLEGRKTVQAGSFKIEAGRRHLDLTVESATPWDVEGPPRAEKEPGRVECVYRVVGDLLTVGTAAAGKARPDNLRAGPGRTVVVYERQKDDTGASPQPVRPGGPTTALNGAWVIESAEPMRLGNRPETTPFKRLVWLIDGTNWACWCDGRLVAEATAEYQPGAPSRVVLTPKPMPQPPQLPGPPPGLKWKGIYQRKGPDELRLCIDLNGNAFPAEFSDDRSNFLYPLKRARGPVPEQAPRGGPGQ